MASNNQISPATGVGIVKADTVDVVAAKVRKFQENGELHFPANYSPENAMKSAWLCIQETKDRNGRPALEVCTKTSIANSLLNMVVQGLNPAKKQCYFIVYGNQLTLQRSYFGAIHIAKTVDPSIEDVTAHVVYEDELESFDIQTVDGYDVVVGHRKNPFRKPGSSEIVGAYATVIYSDGRRRSTVMSMADIKKAWSMSKAGAIRSDGELNPASTHAKFTEEMAKKTVINRACKAIINTSDDSTLLMKAYRETDADIAEAEAQEEIQANANQAPLLVDNDTGEVIDNADGLLAQDAPSDDLP